MSVKPITSTTIYACTECGRLYINEFEAELCHKKYICENCGAQAPQYHLICEKCAKKRDYENATKMSYEEYKEKYPDYMIYYGGEYYADLEDLLDCLKGKELDDYIYGTTKERIELDPYDMLTDLEDNADVEDFEIGEQAEKELCDFIFEWNKKYGQDFYYIDKNIIILLPNEE